MLEQAVSDESHQSASDKGNAADQSGDDAGHPYALMGLVVVSCVLVGLLMSGIGYVGFRFASVQSVLLGLLLVDLVIAAGLTYALFTLRAELDADDRPRKPYGALATFMVATIGLIFVASFLGWTEIAVPATGGLFVWLAATGLILAAALAYVLFTLGPSLDPAHERPRPYPTVGRLVLVGLVAAALLAAFVDINVGRFGTPAALFGLALLRFASILALVYTLFVLNDSIAELRFQRRSQDATTRGPPLKVVPATAEEHPGAARTATPKSNATTD